MEKNKKKLWAEWASKFIFAVLLIIVYLALNNFSKVRESLNGFMSIVSPFLVGVLISYLLYVPCKKIEKLYSLVKIKFISKGARALSVFTIYFMLVLVIVLFNNFAIPALFNSIVELISNVPAFYAYVVDAVQEIPEDSFLKSLNLKDGLIDFTNTYVVKLANIENLGMYAKSVAGILGGIFNFIVSIISSAYILLYRGSILKFLNKLAGVTFKENTHAAIRKYFVKANEIFFRFIASKGLDCIINAIAVSTILLLLNVKYALLFGLMAGIFNAIPFFGSAVACFIIAIITWFTGGFSTAVTVLVLLLIFQQMDANIIEPRIMKSSLKINPLLVIFGVIIGGAYFGVIGMFMAVPVITVFKMILLDYIEYKQISKRQTVNEVYNKNEE